MNKKSIFSSAVVVAAIAVLSIGFIGSGTAQWLESGDETDQDLTNTDTSDIEVGTSFWSEMKSTEANQQNLVKAEPIPVLEDSLERQNLRRRYETLNDQNQQFHVYLMSYGKVVSYYVAQGKVSSVNSKLTQPEQIVKDNGRSGAGEQNDHVVSSPQLDGSYGTNGDGIFFFTTDGSYVEWNGEYLVSERPMNIQTPLSLEAEVNVSQQ